MIAIVVVIGMVIYGILYVLPQFLSGVSGYNAEQSGRILFLSGLPAFLMMPILPRLLRLNLRMMVLSGLTCFAASCFLDTHLSAETRRARTSSGRSCCGASARSSPSCR